MIEQRDYYIEQKDHLRLDLPDISDSDEDDI